MKKKIYLITIWTITLFVIIFSSYRYAKEFRAEYGDLKFQIREFLHGFEDGYEDEEECKSYKNWDEDDSSDMIKGAKNIETNLDEFSKIRVQANVMSLTIKEGSDYRLECIYNKEILKPEYEVSNGLLQIRQNVKRNLHGNSHCKLILTIPSSANISKAEVEVNVGEVSLKDFKCDNLEVETNVGSLSIRDINFNKLDAETNVGELIIKTPEDISNYNLDLQTDLGELKVGDKHYKHSYEHSSSGNKKIKARTNVGELSLE